GERQRAGVTFHVGQRANRLAIRIDELLEDDGGLAAHLGGEAVAALADLGDRHLVALAGGALGGGRGLLLVVLLLGHASPARSILTPGFRCGSATPWRARRARGAARGRPASSSIRWRSPPCCCWWPTTGCSRGAR